MMGLKDLLRGKLTEKQLKNVPSSFDLIGSKEKAVAIIEVPEELGAEAKLIASALMKQHKNVKSVFLKASERKGVYRLRTLKLIAGQRNAVVAHAESGCRFTMDARNVYFSPREGTERMRIAGMVEPGETVMVFFAGAGPFPIVISKKSEAKEIIGIEINPAAVKYFEKNIALNKAHNVKAVLGDAKEKAADFQGACDRVVMPLPESAFEYLEHAIKCLKNSGTIHLYCFSEENAVSGQLKKALGVCRAMKKRCSAAASKVLPYGPGIYKYRLDITIL